jgi:hypothetical protein
MRWDIVIFLGIKEISMTALNDKCKTKKVKFNKSKD